MHEAMDLVEAATAQKTAIILRGVDIGVLGKMLNQQKQEGRAAVSLIEGSSIAPPKGAPEPGKGSLVDVVA